MKNIWVVVILLSGIAVPLYATDQQTSFNQLDQQQLAEVLQQLQIDQLFAAGQQNLIVIDRDDIKRTGLNDLADVIRQLPAVTGSPVSSRSNRNVENLNRNGIFERGSRGADGSTRTDLRGLGIERTLVLIDGRRDISDGDFSLIPLNLVQRIEVLQQGASAIYGADAVGGVINIITRQQFEGLELQAQYGQAFGLVDNPAAEFNPDFSGSDGDAGKASAIYGWRHKRGQLVIGGEYNHQSAVFQGNSSTTSINSAIDILDLQDLAAAGFRGSLNQDINGNGIAGVSDNGGSTAGVGGFFCTATQGPNCDQPSTFDLATGTFRPFNPETDLFNTAQYNLLQTPFERAQGFISSSYKITDYLSANISGRYALRKSRQEFQPPIFIAGPGSLFTLPDERAVFALNVPADNPFNPFGEELDDVRGRLTSVRNIDTNEVQQYTLSTGFNGNFGSNLPGWSWSTQWSFGDSRQTGTTGTDINADFFSFGIFSAFIDEMGVARCGQADGFVLENCTPANIFNGFSNIDGDQIPDMQSTGQNRVFPAMRFDDNLHIVTADINGTLFNLPGGEAIAAFGYIYRNQQQRITRSPMCNSCTLGFFQRRAGGLFEVHSGYAEFNFPILKNTALTESLELVTAIRHDNYSNNDAQTTFKGLLNWRISPNFAVRANFADIYREPTARELFGLETDSFPEILDPCRSSASVISDESIRNFNSFAALTVEQQQQCQQSGVVVTGTDTDGNPLTFDQTGIQPRASVGANENLELETGESFSVGMAFTPQILPGFSLSIDYWNIDLNNTIVVPNPEAILNNCVFGGIDRFCNLIVRQSIGQGLGEVDRIIATLNNDGSESADGVDLAARYRFKSSMGEFNTKLLVTWLNERRTASFDFENSAGEDFSDSINVAGTFSSSNTLQLAVFPEWKGLFTVDWTLGALSAALSMEYLSGVDEALGSGNGLVNRINPEVYIDLSAGYKLATGTEISVGITNIFDNDPPFIVGGLNARTDTNTYRILGRSWFARLTQRF